MISDAKRLKEYIDSLQSNPELRILVAKVKFQQMGEITAEIFKLKLGISTHKCYLRNYLQVLSGEMELYCNIDVNENIETILTKIDEGFTEENWKVIVNSCLGIYEAIYEYCK